MGSRARLPLEQKYEDAEHLGLLSTFHRLLGWLGILVGSFSLVFSLLYVVVVCVVAGSDFPSQAGSEPPPPLWIGLALMTVGLFLAALVLSMSVANLLASKWLLQGKNWTFCFAVACISCLAVPVGTALGVFSMIVLQRPSVRAFFGQSRNS